MRALPRDRVLTCADPDCGGLAEPEQDGEVTYHACRDCGYEFNYQRASAPGTCAAGIPEPVRRSAAFPDQFPDQLPQLPLLQIGRRNADAP